MNGDEQYEAPQRRGLPAAVKGQLVMKGMEVGGSIINTFLSTPHHYDRQADLMDKYYDQMRQIAREEARGEMQRQHIQGSPEPSSPEPRQMGPGGAAPTEGLEKGTACLACSKNHFSAVSGALGEAVRFARDGGISHPEAVRRIGIAIDELNACERIDLAPDAIARLPDRERQVAEWALTQARKLRHMLDEMQNTEDLVQTAAVAADIRTEYLRRLFSLTDANVDVSSVTDKVCARYTGEKRRECEQAVQQFFQKNSNK